MVEKGKARGIKTLKNVLLPNKPKPLKGADKLLEEMNYCCLVFVLKMSNLPCGAARPCLLHAAASTCVFRIDKRVAVFAWQRLEIFLSIW